MNAGIEVFVEAAAHGGGAGLRSIKLGENLFFQPVFSRELRMHGAEAEREMAHLQVVEAAHPLRHHPTGCPGSRTAPRCVAAGTQLARQAKKPEPMSAAKEV